MKEVFVESLTPQFGPLQTGESGFVTDRQGLFGDTFRAETLIREKVQEYGHLLTEEFDFDKTKEDLFTHEIPELFQKLMANDEFQGRIQSLKENINKIWALFIRSGHSSTKVQLAELVFQQLGKPGLVCGVDFTNPEDNSYTAAPGVTATKKATEQIRGSLSCVQPLADSGRPHDPKLQQMAASAAGDVLLRIYKEDGSYEAFNKPTPDMSDEEIRAKHIKLLWENDSVAKPGYVKVVFVTAEAICGFTQNGSTHQQKGAFFESWRTVWVRRVPPEVLVNTPVTRFTNGGFEWLHPQLFSRMELDEGNTRYTETALKMSILGFSPERLLFMDDALKYILQGKKCNNGTGLLRDTNIQGHWMDLIKKYSSYQKIMSEALK